ncbi:hypothetical protein CDD82_3746 [Ophiocordyceps australis]|uniref:Bromo domain-containing protein n=1 Tax=Ophiocordyceps australis TaxID=1399860 RepID=A0A2C5Z534_9HYPO|nr:hypothetical protein CDD82_3746 [Ophiocordyceps australis]
MASTAPDAPQSSELAEHGSKPKVNGHALPNEPLQDDESKPSDESLPDGKPDSVNKQSSGDKIEETQDDTTERPNSGSNSKVNVNLNDRPQDESPAETDVAMPSSAIESPPHSKADNSALTETKPSGVDASLANGDEATSKSATPKRASECDAETKAASESEDKLDRGHPDSSASQEHTAEAEGTKATSEQTKASPSDGKDAQKDSAEAKDSAAIKSIEASENSAAPSQDVEMTDAVPEVTLDSASQKDNSKLSADEQDNASGHHIIKKAESPPDTDMTDAPAHEASGGAEPSKASPAPPATAPSDAPTSQIESGPTNASQAAVDGDDKTSLLTKASASASSIETPNAKAARGREDDSEEPPASKRAKTDPMEDAQLNTEVMQDVKAKDDEPMENAPTTAPAAQSSSLASETLTQPSGAVPDATGLDATFLASLTQWNDKENDAKDITAFQRREIRKIIGRVKKTKSGGHFRDSVQKLWPFLWDSYVERVEKPMDLGELDRSMRDPSGPILSFGDFRKNLGLIFENSLAFNGGVHDITAAAAQAVRTIWEEVVPIPAEEPVRLRSLPKVKPVRESRAVTQTENAAAQQRRSVGPAAVKPVASEATAKDGAPAQPAAPAAAAASAPRQSHASQESANARRGSSATDGDRPKRTVRAPKPKDIDYTTKPSRKKLKPELQFCDEVLTELMHPKHYDVNKWFLEPVDAEGLAVPNYYSIIKKPMDLGQVQRMLGNGDISTSKEFDKNVRLIFENCYSFNGKPSEGHPVAMVCEKLEKLYTSQMKGKDAWISKHAARSHAAAAASASNASDDEDEDEGDAGDVGESVTDSREIEELQAKLEEETKKLNGMLLGGNQSLIDIQKGIVDMVQNALIKTAQAVQQARAKNEKASKKTGKTPKASAKAPASRKQSGSAGQSRKSTGSTKKAAPKKTLTGPQKDLIASAINDLESDSLDSAIDIIKRDTGQNENNDGELELDIDQLSNEALNKLWDLCKDALPGFGKDLAAAPKSSPEVNRSGPTKQAPKTAAKPKKNKPMSAQEQEARIQQLTAIRNLFKPGQEPAGADSQKVTQTPTPMADSSDDSDSEEE